jgi:hypothetical protein
VFFNHPSFCSSTKTRHAASKTHRDRWKHSPLTRLLLVSNLVNILGHGAPASACLVLLLLLLLGVVLCCSLSAHARWFGGVVLSRVVVVGGGGRPMRAMGRKAIL